MLIQSTRTPPTTVDWNGQTYIVLLTAKESNGRLGVFESIAAPGGGPPRHIHLKEDEAFYVIEGEMVFWIEGTTYSRKAGEVAYIPCGREHAFMVGGSKRARWVTHLTPGGFEGFFPAVAARDFKIPEDSKAVAELALTFNMKVTGPPLHA